MILELLNKTSGISEKTLLNFAATASKRYKVYTIPKRSGGNRTIEQPSREIKALQRWIIKVLVARFPLHEAATAYKKGSGIGKNAEQHKKTRFTNRYDFADFFPSFSQSSVRTFFYRELSKISMKADNNDLHFITNIVCRNGRLTIGAPSSPALTNAMMFAFDQKLANYCQAQNLVYTRYADDIFISSYEENKLNNMDKFIRQYLNEIPYLRKLKLKQEKTVYLSRKYKRSITGIIITPEGDLSIGRDRKREIRALIHKWIMNALDGSEKQNINYLKGLFSFAIDIEPDFEKSLIAKYGKRHIKSLRSAIPESTID